MNEIELKLAELSREFGKLHQKKIDEYNRFGRTTMSADECALFDEAMEFIINTGRFDFLISCFRECSIYECNWIQEAFVICKDLIPKDQLYDFTLQVYVKNGFDFPRESIIELMKIRPNDYLANFPDELKSTDLITVYRASTTPPKHIDKVSSELSWTIDPYVAMYWYRYRKIDLDEPCYIYLGEIHKNDIIAYVGNGAQCEVIQYGKVKEVTPMSENSLSMRCKTYSIGYGDDSDNLCSGKNMCKQQAKALGIQDTSTNYVLNPNAFITDMGELARAMKAFEKEIGGQIMWGKLGFKQ